MIYWQPEKLKAWRERLGWTQGEAAQRLCLSRAAYNRMEQGHTPIEKRTALGCEFLEGMEMALRLHTHTALERSSVDPATHSLARAVLWLREELEVADRQIEALTAGLFKTSSSSDGRIVDTTAETLASEHRKREELAGLLADLATEHAPH